MPARKANSKLPKPETHAPATLEEVVNSLGGAVITVLAAPCGLDVPLTEPVILDPLLDSPMEAGDILLAVGTSPASDAARAIIERAGACRAGAVVFKVTGPPPPELAAASAASGVAALAVDPHTAWGQFYALLRTALARAGRPPEATDAGVHIGDLFALANAVSAMVGGAVTIEDPHSRVLAYSSYDEPLDEPRRQTILGRRVPAEWRQRLQDEGVLRKLWSSGDVIHYNDPEYPGFRPRIAIAVRAGGEILGSIWVAEGRTAFTEQTAHALREAAGIAALHLIRARTFDDLERRIRGDLVRSVVEGTGPVEPAASRLGMEADAPVAVLAFEPEATDEAEAALRRERVLDLVILYCRAFRRRAACASIGSTIYALVPADPDRPQSVRNLARDVSDRANTSLGVKLLTGLGSIVSGLREAPRSRREADAVVRVLTSSGGRSTLASIEEVRPRAILLELRDLAVERPHLLEGKLQTLREHDAAHGTPYVATLRKYLDAMGDVIGASEEMGVHPNTFRYRLRRLVEVSGIDLDDPDERAVTQLQFRMS